MEKRKADVAIVGAGIVGLFCAYFLARRGLKVVVVERKMPGSGSSTRTGGGVRSQFGTATNIRLSLLSAPYWTEFEDRFGVNVGLRRIGYLFLAPDDKSLQSLESQVALQNQLGVGSELLAGGEVSTRWPSLGSLNLAGASFCATDGFLNHHRAIQALTRSVEAAGVTIECGTGVTGVDFKAGRIEALQTTNGTIPADLIVNCAGAWAAILGEQFGVSLPITGRRVQLLLARPARSLPPDLPWLIDPVRQVHMRQDADGRALVGGFMGDYEVVDPAAFDHDADPHWIAAVVQQASQSFGIEIDPLSVVDSWAGLYPCTPDQHPIIDHTNTGMVVVGGFAGFGLMHAPAAGLVTAELILDGHISSVDPDEVSLARFSKPITTVEQTGF